MVGSEMKLPEDFLKQIKGMLGDSFPDFLISIGQPAPTSIRLNHYKPISSIAGKPVPWCSTGLYLDDRPVFTLDPLFHGGAYYVQEASSMFLEQVFLHLGLSSKPLRILDVSAAPGGKSTHLASLMHQDSLLVANEVIRSRATILEENLTKWGVGNVVITNNDPESFQKLPGFFDVMVVDAPCSGEGLFRKDPEAMQEWSEENVHLCSKRQRRILSDIWPSLKSNGILIYCTCTYNPRENEENMQWLSEQHEVESLSIPLQNHWGIEKISYKTITGYRFYPHKVKGEGFFISVIKKNSFQDEVPIRTKRKPVLPPATILDELSRWLNRSENFTFELIDNYVIAYANALAGEIDKLNNTLRVIRSGTTLATLKGHKPIPEHALALSTKINKQHFPSLDLSLNQALAFLRKESIILTEYVKGYTLVTYQSQPIGWMNILDNRVNNLYPKTWRIRMQN